jgi:hypothetical protein
MRERTIAESEGTPRASALDQVKGEFVTTANEPDNLPVISDSSVRRRQIPLPCSKMSIILSSDNQVSWVVTRQGDRVGKLVETAASEEKNAAKNPIGEKPAVLFPQICQQLNHWQHLATRKVLPNLCENIVWECHDMRVKTQAQRAGRAVGFKPHR